MTVARPETLLREHPVDAGSSDPVVASVLVESKLHAPHVRDQLVPRADLMDRLSEGAGTRLTLVACPAGYGKTSLLAAWHRAEALRRPSAWLGIDRDDNDPAVLWAHLVEALRRADPGLGLDPAHRLASRGPAVELQLPALANALGSRGGLTLILDDFHLLTDARPRALVAWLVDHAPPTFQLVLSTRQEPDLALAALRAHGDLVELRADDLRFSVEEAEEFLNGSQHLGLSRPDVDLLVERTGGWPAGLYLAALSLRRAGDRHDLVTRFGASQRHVLDFLESEVMQAHDAADRELMMRSSILPRLSGALCDAVLDRSGSNAALRRLARSNLFLIPLDDDGTWYRFHPLFAQLLRVELERDRPGLAPELHRRAFSWTIAYGEPSDAIEHALRAGMVTEAADHVAEYWYAQINSGGYASVLSWLDRLPSDVVDGDVRLLLAQAWTLSMSGQQEKAAVSIARAEPLVGSHVGPLPDGFSSAEASLATLRGVFPWGDVRKAHSSALRALELEPPGSRWHPLAVWAVAMAHLWRGEYTEADALFAEAITWATSSSHWLMASAALAYRSLIAGHAGDLDRQAQLAGESDAVAREHGLTDHTPGPSMAIGMSLNARGRYDEALPVLERAVALARFPGQPLILVRTLRYLAETLTTLGRTDEAARAAAEARSVLAACADPARARAPSRPRPRESSTHVVERLTNREVTVLTLLAGDLSEADIGRELFVSHSTVHSHARSIYRKLGVSSRADAVARARAAGYL